MAKVIECGAMNISCWSILLALPCPADSSRNLEEPALTLRFGALSETDDAQASEDRRAEKAEETRR